MVREVIKHIKKYKALDILKKEIPDFMQNKTHKFLIAVVGANGVVRVIRTDSEPVATENQDSSEDVPTDLDDKLDDYINRTH